MYLCKTLFGLLQVCDSDCPPTAHSHTVHGCYQQQQSYSCGVEGWKAHHRGNEREVRFEMRKKCDQVSFKSSICDQNSPNIRPINHQSIEKKKESFQKYVYEKPNCCWFFVCLTKQFMDGSLCLLYVLL